MKKKIILITVLLVLSNGLFARGFYNGNFQLTGGYNANELVKKSDQSHMVRMDAFNFGMETWHTFGLPLFLEAGFMFDIDFGAGTSNMVYYDNDLSMNIYGLLGPAIAINILEIVKFNIGFGPNFEGNINFSDNLNLFAFGLGFGFNIQANFLPISPVSPIIGYKFAVIQEEMVYEYIENEFDINATSILSFKNEVYLGISFNW